MLLRKVFILICFAVVSQNVFSLSNSNKHKVYDVDYKSLKYQSIGFAEREYIPLSKAHKSLRFGETRYSAYRLPHRGESYKFEIRSYVNTDGGINTYFYPIIDVLDKDFHLLYTITSSTEVRATENLLKKYTLHEINVNENTEYIVIYTSPKLKGKKISYKDQHTSSNSYFINGTTFFIPGNTSAFLNAAEFSDDGKIEYLTPHVGHDEIVVVPHGWLFELGYSFGGDTLAAATDEGSDIDAGSGVYISGGYSFRSFFHPRITLRTTFGYKFDEAETNYGNTDTETWVVGAKAFYSFEYVNLGFGLNYHVEPEFASSSLSREFNSAFGPSLDIELRLMKTGYAGISFTSMEYEDKQTNEVLNADQLSFVLGFMFY